MGSRTLNALTTFGGSVIGDAINDISPNVANTISKYSAGMISPTSQQYLESNRNSENNNRLNNSANAISSQLAGEMIGAGLNKGVEFVGNKIPKIEVLPKPNPNAHYRNIGGKKGYIDVVSRGEVAPPLVSKRGENLSLRDLDGKVVLRQKQFNRSFYARKGQFSPSLRYSGPYAVEADIPMKGPWGGNWGNAPDPEITGFMNVPVNNSNVRLLKQYRFPGTEKVLFQKVLSKKINK